VVENNSRRSFLFSARDVEGLLKMAEYVKQGGIFSMEVMREFAFEQHKQKTKDKNWRKKKARAPPQKSKLISLARFPDVRLQNRRYLFSV